MTERWPAVILIASLSLLPSAGGAQNLTSKEPQQSSLPLVSVPVKVLSLPDDTPLVTEQKRLDSERDKQNLAAQQSVADSTIKLLYWTRLQFWLGLAGAIGLIITLALNVLQIRMSRHALTSTERAFVSGASFRWISHSDFVSGKVFWRLRPSWINHGNTPTKEIDLYVGYRLVDQPLKDDFDFEFQSTGFRRTPLGKNGGVIESESFDISSEDMQAVQHKSKHLYLFGQILYRYIFENTKTHLTQFCFHVITITGDPTKPWNEESNNVDLILAHMPKHNIAD